MIAGSLLFASAAIPQGMAGDSSSQRAKASEQAPEEQTEERSTTAIVVTGRRRNLIGRAITASEGRVARDEILARPLLRSGDLLELVPGLVATQHSGSGKANQYFLRGFNLDHGTDFATSVDGMPVNMRSHGHGQGWTDLNFLIPETVEELSYSKGVYLAETGDFGSAGSARFTLAKEVSHGTAEIGAGSYGHLRAVAVHSARLGPSNLLLAGELQAFDGPWSDLNERVRKANGLVRFSTPVGSGDAHVTAMAYRNSWRSPDQIPSRAVDAGIGQFGSIDTTLGGQASRFSLSGGWTGKLAGGELEATAYAIRSKLNLFSNFTYFLDDPVNGDQFRQVDERWLAGFEARQSWDVGASSRLNVGLQGRLDDIGRVGLFRTRARELLDTVRDDGVRQSSIGAYVSHEMKLTDRLRSTLGVRYDAIWARVNARSSPINSGSSSDGKFSLKANLAYRAAEPLELYASYGEGFHSNDARGTTIRVDPVSGEPAARVPALVGTRGGELGLRWFPRGKIHATLAAWTLALGSELVFVGDAGGTEPSRPSRRSGLELGVYLFPGGPLSGEFELSYTRARFSDPDPSGRRIPGSLPLVISGGVKWQPASGWSVSPRVRYVGRYPLIEDGSVKADPSLLVNLRVAREFQQFAVGLELFNLLDRRDQDIAYLYPSRLPGEPAAGVDDVHYHVFQPRSARLTLSRRL